MKPLAIIIPDSKSPDTRDLTQRAHAIRQAAAASESAMNQSGMWLVIEGMELRGAQLALGETRGGNHDTPRLTFDAWLDEQNALFASSKGCEGFGRSRSRAMQLIATAKAVEKRLLKTGREVIEHVLGVAPSALDATGRLQLHEAVRDFVDERTFTDIARECGVIKRPKESGSRNKPKPPDPEKPKPNFAPDEWREYITLDEAAREAVDAARSLCNDLRDVIAGTLAHLPARWRDELRALITAAAEKIPAHVAKKARAK